MRVAITIVGVLLMLIGSIWVLQGIDVLPGSFMTGQLQWAVYGALTILAGAAAVWVARKTRRRSTLP